MSRGYRPGDHWKVCDVCGFRYRASETRKRWDGLMVCEADFEERHPQDFVRGRTDRQRVPDPRPVPTDVFVSGSDDVVYASDGEQVFTADGDFVVI